MPLRTAGSIPSRWRAPRRPEVTRPAAATEARPDARAERQRHYAFGVVRDPAEAFAQREGRRVR